MAQAALALAPDLIKQAPAIIKEAAPVLQTGITESRGLISDIGKGFKNLFGIEDVDVKQQQAHVEKLNKAKLEQELATMNLSAAEKDKIRAFYATQQKAMFDQQLALAKLERDQEFSRSKQKVDNIKDLYSFMGSIDKDVFNSKDLKYKMLKDALFSEIRNYVDTDAMLQDYKTKSRNYRNNRQLTPDIYRQSNYAGYRRGKEEYYPSFEQPEDADSLTGYGEL